MNEMVNSRETLPEVGEGVGFRAQGLGIMEKKMETTIMGYIGFRV